MQTISLTRNLENQYGGSAASASVIQLVKIEAKIKGHSLTGLISIIYKRNKYVVLVYNFLRSKRKRNVVLTLSRTRQKRPGCYKILEERSEAKGIGPILSKNEGKTNRCIPKILENETERSELF